MANLGKYLIIIGAFIIVAGIIIWLFSNKLGWFGQLPGDINIERKNFRFYAPLTSMLLLSIFLSLIIWLINRFSK